MDKFCIITNKSKDPDMEVTEHIRQFLTQKGKDCVIAESAKIPLADDKAKREHLSAIPDDADCCIVLGGDGTMLQAARSVAFQDIPLIGVNLGTLGYLAEVEKSGIDDALDKLLQGNYQVEGRMMLRGSVNGKKDYALNDIVITRVSSIQIVSYNIYINGLFLCKYKADGVIISTPTGSTGYSMSAGGPIVEPSADMILITPICSHKLGSKSLVLSSDSEIVVEIEEASSSHPPKVAASFDGSSLLDLNCGDRIEIKKSKKTTKILKLNRVSFLEVLSKKFDE